MEAAADANGHVKASLIVMLKATVNSLIGSKLRIEVAEAGSEDMRRLKTAAESRRFLSFSKGGGKEAFSGDETKRKEDRMPMSSAALEES